MMNEKRKSIIYAIIVFASIILLHRMPLYLFFEYIGITEEISDLLDKIVLNLVVIGFAIKEISKMKLWEQSGLGLKSMLSPYLYLILLFYLFLFTGGFSTFKMIKNEDLATVLVFVFAVKSISVGILEEVIFRGLIQSKILGAYEKEKNGLFKGVIISALIFGLAHAINIGQDYIGFYGVLRQIFAASCLGALFGSILIRTKNIYPIIIIHGAISFFSLLGTLFPGYFPEQQSIEKSTLEIIASLIFVILLFGSALVISLFLLRNMNKKNNQKLSSAND